LLAVYGLLFVIFCINFQVKVSAKSVVGG